MDKILLMGVCLLPLVAGCRQNELAQEVNNVEAAIKLRASVSVPGLSRTVFDAEDASTSFSEGDAIGFFMPEDENQVKWTLSGDGWNSEVPLMWENKVDEFEFCAYYPYAEDTESRESVPMPDLSAQKGDAAGIGAYDFLAARCTSSYSSNSGAVSFVGNHAFRHVCTLLSVTIKKDLSGEDVRISGATLRGTGLFSRMRYKFAPSSVDDGVQPASSPSVDELSFDYEEPVEIPDETGYSLFIICNPTVLSESPRFSIAYVRDGISYTATTDKLGKEFLSGTFNKYTLKLTKEGLELVGQEIAGWDEEVIPDIPLTETPAE